MNSGMRKKVDAALSFILISWKVFFFNSDKYDTSSVFYGLIFKNCFNRSFFQNRFSKFHPKRVIYERFHIHYKIFPCKKQLNFHYPPNSLLVDHYNKLNFPKKSETSDMIPSKKW